MDFIEIYNENFQKLKTVKLLLISKLYLFKNFLIKKRSHRNYYFYESFLDFIEIYRQKSLFFLR